MPIRKRAQVREAGRTRRPPLSSNTSRVENGLQPCVETVQGKCRWSSVPLRGKRMNQRRIPSPSQRRGRNVAGSGHVTNGSRGKANAAGRKARANGRKKSKAFNPMPFPAHMGHDLKGKPARRKRRNGQHDPANRPPERNKEEKGQGTSKGRQKPGKQEGKRKASENRTT